MFPTGSYPHQTQRKECVSDFGITMRAGRIRKDHLAAQQLLACGAGACGQVLVPALPHFFKGSRRLHPGGRTRCRFHHGQHTPERAGSTFGRHAALNQPCSRPNGTKNEGDTDHHCNHGIDPHAASVRPPKARAYPCITRPMPF